MDLKKLFKWYNENGRNLPWRRTRDPYKIWVSEIILQQTRVNQGLEYYHQFINHFPTIESLAKADENEVLKNWEGLGYYSRARNMHFTAREIMDKHNGKFPAKYKDLLNLKGVGPYTAAAIASFAFNEKVAAVDGNVIRVLARIFGIDYDANSSQGKKIFTKKANELIDKKQPGLFNQAMMEFGALQCIPSSPSCKNCIFTTTCIANQTGKVTDLPIKKKKKKPVNKYLHFFIIEKDNTFLIEQRTENGIWKNLYQLPLWESQKNETPTPSKISKSFYKNYHLKKIDEIKKLNETIHILSHQKLHISFWKLKTSGKKGLYISKEQIRHYPFPIVIAKFLDNYFN
jgi:A/G-specific adenine glycosylase